jgi:hypothetical protein
MLKNQKIKNNLIFVFNGSNNIESLKGNSINGIFYYMPKEEGVIGGTFIKGYDGTDEWLNKKMCTEIVERARYVFNGINPKVFKPNF